jgi:hypothetical protein
VHKVQAVQQPSTLSMTCLLGKHCHSGTLAKCDRQCYNSRTWPRYIPNGTECPHVTGMQYHSQYCSTPPCHSVLFTVLQHTTPPLSNTLYQTLPGSTSKPLVMLTVLAPGGTTFTTAAEPTVFPCSTTPVCLLSALLSSLTGRSGTSVARLAPSINQLW